METGMMIEHVLGLLGSGQCGGRLHSKRNRGRKKLGGYQIKDVKKCL